MNKQYPIPVASGAGGSGGSGTPGGNPGDIQFNSSGTFGGETLVPLANGGTNADLSASGSATAVLAQAANHVISARNLVAADIPQSVIALPTAGFPSPSPVYSINEAPSDENPAIYIQDKNGDWHQQAGIDTTTTSSAGSGPTPPDGTLTFYRRTWFRDTELTTQGFKNAFICINHAAGIGTAQTNQDRALAVSMSNASCTIQSFSIDGSNNVTFNLSVLPNRALPGMHFKPNGFSTTVGLLLNGTDLTVTSVTAGTVVASGFTHSSVGNTVDAGFLDQSMYAMEGIQVEVDVVGHSPVFTGSPDGEVVAGSFQLSYAVNADVNAPPFGVCAVRAENFRSGAGNVVDTAIGWMGINAIVTNISTSTMNNTSMAAVRVQAVDQSGGAALGTGVGLFVASPLASRFTAHNYGIFIEDFGSTSGDYPLYITGGLSHFGGTTEFSAVPSFPSQTANTFFAATDGAPSIPAFRALAPNDYPTMGGDAGTGGTKGAVPAPGSGDTAASKFLKADGTWQTPSVPASSVTWSNITAATGNLQLLNGTNTTEFDQTSNVAWLWKNTTTATSGTTNASPLLEVGAKAWNGASIDDIWTIGTSLVAGSNAQSNLNFTHSTGSTGTAAVVFPAGSAGHNSIQWSGVNTGIFGQNNFISLDCTVTNGSGLAIYGGSTPISFLKTIRPSGNATGNVLETRERNTYMAISGTVREGTTNPCIVLTNSDALGESFTATSGTQTGVLVGPVAGGTMTFAPTSGNAKFICTNINPTINQTGGANGAVTSLLVNAVETAVGGTHLLLDLQAGATGGTSEFAVKNNGTISKYNAITTVSQGVASEIYQTLNPTLSANFNAGSAVTMFTPTVAKAWRISACEGANVAATAGTMPSLTVGWTDAGGIARTAILLASTITSATTDYVQGSLIIYTDNATAVTITSASYAAGSGTALAYSLACTAEAM